MRSTVVVARHSLGSSLSTLASGGYFGRPQKLVSLTPSHLGPTLLTGMFYGQLSMPHFRMFSSHTTSKGPVTADQDPAQHPKWNDPNLPFLTESNKKWAFDKRSDNPDFFRDGMKAHKPNILWIGCSDARVPAHEIIGEPAGSVFVHRNIANMVVNTDVNCMSILQYAIDVLKVRHIIVCGHYDCGGIKAALTNKNNVSPLENWLRNIRDVHRLHYQELNALPDRQSLERRLVELNVIEQCLNIFKTGVVQKRRVESRQAKEAGDKSILFMEPRIHPFVYEPTTGEAKKLDVDFKNMIKGLQKIYELYSTKNQNTDLGTGGLY